MSETTRETVIQEAIRLAEDLQRVCLHGEPPIDTTMKLATGVLELKANQDTIAAVKEKIDKAYDNLSRSIRPCETRRSRPK